MEIMRRIVAATALLLLGCGEPTWQSRLLAGNWTGQIGSESQPVELRLALREPTGSKVTATGEVAQEILSYGGFDIPAVDVYGVGRIDEGRVSLDLTYARTSNPIPFRFTGAMHGSREIRGQLHDLFGVGTVRPVVLFRDR